MPKTTTARKPKTETKPLTTAEVKRLADRLALVLTADHQSASENAALMTLLFDHLQHVETDIDELALTIDTVKRSLFAATDEADKAQESFQAEAFKNRGKLLLFPYEPRGNA